VNLVPGVGHFHFSLFLPSLMRLNIPNYVYNLHKASFRDGQFPVTSTIIKIYHSGSIFRFFITIAMVELLEDSDDEIIVPPGCSNLLKMSSWEKYGRMIR
jgi:hypothetical protein